MEHITEFNFFGRDKSSEGSNEALRLFLEENWGTIQSIFDRNSRLYATGYEVYTNMLFAVSYDPPNNEMPAEISYVVEAILKKVSEVIGDPDLTWRFGVDDPFLIRFILSKPFV